MGLPRSHAGSRIHPFDCRGALQRRLHDQLEIECVSRNSGTHLRSSVRARMPPRPRRGNAGCDLPPEARRRRLQGRRQAPHAEAAGEERQAHRAGRRRSRLAGGGARSRAARLSLHRVRCRSQGGRHDAEPDSKVPPAGFGDRRGDRLHPQPRRRLQGRSSHRQPEEAARRKLRRDLHRLRRAARPRARHPRPQGSSRQHPHRHRMAVVGLVRPCREDRPARHRARRRQHRDGLLPHRAPPRRRGRQGDRAFRLRGNEGEPLGKGRRASRGYPDPQFHGAGGIQACQPAS